MTDDHTDLITALDRLGEHDRQRTPSDLSAPLCALAPPARPRAAALRLRFRPAAPWLAAAAAVGLAALLLMPTSDPRAAALLTEIEFSTALGDEWFPLPADTPGLARDLAAQADQLDRDLTDFRTDWTGDAL